MPMAVPDLAIPDLSQLDKAYQEISAVEKSWALPPLPDEVKLDLITTPEIAGGARDFLYGLVSDLEASVQGPPPAVQFQQAPDPVVEEEQAAAVASRPGPQRPPHALFLPEDSVLNDLRRVWSGISGGRAPEVLADNAVADIKRRAISAGLLPPGTPIDNFWSPEMNGVRYDLMQEDFRRRIAGDRPGAASTRDVMQLLEDWATPQGLLTAAMALDFVPDPKAIARETSSWGEKISKAIRNPTSPRDWIDALTGPIDDIVFPIVNTALLFTGWRTLPTFIQGASLIRNANAFTNVGRASEGAIAAVRGLGRAGVTFGGRTFGAVSAADIANDVANMTRAGILTGKLGRVLPSSGRAMDAWRQHMAVMSTKKAIQQGMKLGFIGQLEALATPNRDPGIGFFGQIDTPFRAHINDYQNFRTYNPVAYPVLSVLEIGLTPMSIFKPGTFASKLSKKEADLTKAFQKVVEDERYGGEILNGALVWAQDRDPVLFAKLQAVLKGDWSKLDDPTRSALSEAAKKHGTKRLPGMSPTLNPAHAALLVLLGNGDAEKAGMVAAYLGLAAALEKAAKADAVRATGLTEGLKFERAKQTFRNHYINRLREIDDLDPNDPQSVLDYIGTRSGVDAVDNPALRRQVKEALELPEGMPRSNLSEAEVDEITGQWMDPEEAKKVLASRNKTYRNLVDEFTDPARHDDMVARAAAEIEHHNANRMATLNELFDQLDHGEVAGYLNDHNVWETITNWDTFVHSLDVLQETLGFRPEMVNLKSVKNVFRDKAWVPSAIEAEVDGVLLPAQKVKSSWTNSLQKDVIEGQTRVTVARLDAPTVQEAELLHAQISHMESLRKALRTTSGDTMLGLEDSLRGYAQTLGKDVKDLSRKDIQNWLKSRDHVGGPPRSVAERFARAYRWAAAQGMSAQSAVDDLGRRLNAINDNTELWSRWRVHSNRTLAEKLEQLNANKALYAQAVDVDPELAERMARAGYKIVAGTDFMVPSDLMDLTGPLGAIRAKSLRRAALGTFMTRHTNEVLVAMKERRFRNLAAQKLKELERRGIDLGRPFAIDPRGVDMDEVVQQMSAKRNVMLEIAHAQEEVAQSQGLLSATLTRAANTGLPQSRWMMRDKALDEVFTQLGFSKEAAKALKAAAAQANNIGMRYQGLQAIESFLVGNSWVRLGLKTFGGTEAADTLDDMSRPARVAKRLFTGKAAPPAIDLWRNYRRAATGVAAGALTAGAQETMTGEMDPLSVAGAAALGAALPGAVRPAPVIALAGTMLAGEMAEIAGLDPTQALLAGVGVGIGGPVAIRLRNPARAGGLLDTKGWAEYSRLGKGAALLRDRVRFALNPIFDIQRYTEGMVLGATAKLPDGVELPITARPMRKAIEMTGKSRQQIIDEYNLVAGGRFDLMESTQARFREIGILGFSPHEWEAAAVAQMVHQGMAPEEAFRTAREIYTYGMTGRSGLELSVNFVFFPFSFAKKYFGQMAKFMAQDLGRTVAIHDALKMWDILYEEFDLGERWREHLPVLDMIRKINPLAFGISPGELGGINRPFIDMVMDAPIVGSAARETVNFFLPVAMEINTEADADQAVRIAKRLLPIWRDAEDMLQGLYEQGHVVASGTWMTRRAQIERAYDEWTQLKREVQQLARENGLTLQQVMSTNPESRYAPVRQFMDQRKAEIMEKYPAWEEALDEGVNRAIERNQDIRAITTNPESPEELAMAQYQTFVDALELIMGEQGLTLTNDADLVDPEMQHQFRVAAIDLASQVPGFATLYRKYYQRLFGPIHRELH